MLGFVSAVAISTKKYTRSVSDFLAANRCAGRYLLCVATGTSSIGAISIVAMFEVYYETGFTALWWIMMTSSVGLFIALSGWVLYRYRETRALTLAQFFEVRYSKRFRIFCGILGWLSGIINFGLFPAVGTRFFIHYCGLPQYYINLWGAELDLVYAGLMIILIAIAVLFVFLGGQIAVIVTDFIQGIFMNIGFVIILIVLLCMLDWSDIVETLKATPVQESMLNPRKTGAHAQFNPGYFFILVFVTSYGTLAWQGSQAYYCSATSAHEARMAGILGRWRDVVVILGTMFMPIAAYAVMHSNADPQLVNIAAEAKTSLSQIDDQTIRTQMTVPVTLAGMLPVGVVGLFCAMMLAAFISSTDTYLHSWGSIFIQDVILPFRKKPFTQRQHIRLLRLSIIFVAVFIFIWSLLFQQNEAILMFFAVTGAIYMGGAGSAIIGGLYWKRGTTAGAWVAMITGCTIAISGLIAQQTWSSSIYPWMESEAPYLIDWLTFSLEGISDRVWGINWQVGPDRFPLDGQWINMLAMLLAIGGYIGCSLVAWIIFKRPAFNMERLLHRGKYAIAGDHEQNVDTPVSGLKAILPSREFSRGDKFIYYSQLTWTVGWVLVFLIGSFYNYYADVSDDSWAKFWAFYVAISFVVVVVTTVWFLIGGAFDMKNLFKRLVTAREIPDDTGMVVDHRNLADVDDRAGVAK